MKKGGCKSKAELLIEEGGGVPWGKKRRKRKMSCGDVSIHLESLIWSESIVERSLLEKIKRHVNDCSNCRKEKVGHLLFPKRNNTNY